MFRTQPFRSGLMVLKAEFGDMFYFVLSLLANNYFPTSLSTAIAVCLLLQGKQHDPSLKAKKSPSPWCQSCWMWLWLSGEWRVTTLSVVKPGGNNGQFEFHFVILWSHNPLSPSWPRLLWLVVTVHVPSPATHCECMQLLLLHLV